MEAYWYVLRVMPGKERQISDEYNEKITLGKITNILKFVCPIEKEMITLRKKKVLRDKVIYSGYIYFETENKLTEDELKIISGHENVMSMSGTKLPQLLRQSDVDRIVSVTNKKLEKTTDNTEKYYTDENVEITCGPFSGFTGIIKEIINDKVTLETIVFGRPTKVTLNKNEIKKI